MGLKDNDGLGPNLRQTREVALNAYVDHLGLELMSVYQIEGGLRLQTYGWSSRFNGTPKDRLVMVLIYRDGSWTDSLDTGSLNIDQGAAIMRAMVRAQP